MPQRLTLLMQIATNPGDRSAASPHIAGWSESWWTITPIDPTADYITSLASKRAALLPAQGSVIGYRLANYTISGNRLLPTGSSTGKLQYPGNPTRPTDLPQVALEMSGSSSGVANTSRFVLRGIPDEMMVGGEYQPSGAFKGSVTVFSNELIMRAWAFLARDLTQPNVKVLSAAGGVLRVEASTGAALNDYVRFRRVYDDDNVPISGAFRVTNVADGGLTLTLSNFTRVVTVANGTVRKDLLALQLFRTINPSRAVIKKVGRPFESYRGRQSKRRAI